MYRQFKYTQLLFGIAYLGNILVASDYKHPLLKNGDCNDAYSIFQNDSSHYTKHQQTYKGQLKANNTVNDCWDFPNPLSIGQNNEKREISHDILLLYKTIYRAAPCKSDIVPNIIHGFRYDTITPSKKFKSELSLLGIYDLAGIEKRLYLDNSGVIFNVATVDSIKKMVKKYLKNRNKRKGEVVGHKIISHGSGTKKEITITNVGELSSALYPYQSTDIHLLQLAYQTDNELNFFHLAVVAKPILHYMKWTKIFQSRRLPKGSHSFSQKIEEFELSSIHLFTLLLREYAVVEKNGILEIPLLGNKNNKKYLLRFYCSHVTGRLNKQLAENQITKYEYLYTLSFTKHKTSPSHVFTYFQDTYSRRGKVLRNGAFLRNHNSLGVVFPAADSSLHDVMHRGMRNKILVKGYMRTLNSVYILPSLYELIVSFYGS